MSCKGKLGVESLLLTFQIDDVVIPHHYDLSGGWRIFFQPLFVLRGAACLDGYAAVISCPSYSCHL